MPKLLKDAGYCTAAGPERTVFFTRREGGVADGGKTIDAVRRGD